MAVRRETTDNDSSPEKVGTRFTVSNPHPGFVDGDPNIKNELGHTNYPKWIDHPTLKQKHVTTSYLANKDSRTNVITCDGKDGRPDIAEKVLVNSEEEEKALLAGEEPIKAWGGGKGKK